MSLAFCLWVQHCSSHWFPRTTGICACTGTCLPVQARTTAAILIQLSVPQRTAALVLRQPHVLPTGAELQQLLASKDALVSQGGKQALAAVTVAASAELAAMRSTLQVLSSHLEALQTDAAALGTKSRLPSLMGHFGPLWYAYSECCN